MKEYEYISLLKNMIIHNSNLFCAYFIIRKNRRIH